MSPAKSLRAAAARAARIRLQPLGEHVMAFTGPVEDRLAIHELVATYGDAVTRRDGDAWANCWAEDSVWCLPAIPGMEEIKGRAAIRAAWEAAMPGWPFQVNIQTLGAVTI